MISDSDIIKTAESGLKKELTVALIYIKLAEKYRKKDIAKKLLEFSEVEKGHAAFWRSFLIERKINPDIVKASQFQVSFLAIVYGLLGLGLTLKLLESGERKVIEIFLKVSKSDLLSPTEKKNVKTFLLDELEHEQEFVEYSTRYKVFINKIGIIFSQTSDGLVIVLSTAIGLSGVYNHSVLIGIAGLIVGFAATLSTVVGSYFFTRTEKRLKEDILKRIKLTCDCAPEAYQQRIEKYMKNKNYDPEIAKTIALEAREKNMIERIIAEEEYGIGEKTLGDPFMNALQSGLFKTIGTILPLLPFIAGYPVDFSILVSVTITVVLLSIVGSLAAVVAQVDVKKKVIELITAGLILSGLTFLLGKLTAILIGMIQVA
jgi:VIT1/CCC1 family predicted Fe2+/Mn2+ transporter